MIFSQPYFPSVAARRRAKEKRKRKCRVKWSQIILHILSRASSTPSLSSSSCTPSRAALATVRKKVSGFLIAFDILFCVSLPVPSITISNCPRYPRRYNDQASVCTDICISANVVISGLISSDVNRISDTISNISILTIIYLSLGIRVTFQDYEK